MTRRPNFPPLDYNPGVIALLWALAIVLLLLLAG